MCNYFWTTIGNRRSFRSFPSLRPVIRAAIVLALAWAYQLVVEGENDEYGEAVYDVRTGRAMDTDGVDDVEVCPGKTSQKQTCEAVAIVHVIW